MKQLSISPFYECWQQDGVKRQKQMKLSMHRASVLTNPLAVRQRAAAYEALSDRLGQINVWLLSAQAGWFELTLSTNDFLAGDSAKEMIWTTLESSAPNDFQIGLKCRAVLECIFVFWWSGKAVQQETGNDFRFADWRMDLLEEWSAESENALGLRCPAAVVIAQFIGGGM